MKKVPHVVLMLGPRVPGIEIEVEEVLKKVKPVVLATEFFAPPDTRDQELADLAANAERLVNHDRSEVAYNARIFITARRGSLHFIAGEQPDLAFYNKVELARLRVSSLTRRALAMFQEGKLDNAIAYFKEALENERTINVEREQSAVDAIKLRAHQFEGPIALLWSSLHTGIVQKLRKSGFNVSVYHAQVHGPLSNALVTTSSTKSISRTTIVKALFFQMFSKYLTDRYNFSALHHSNFLSVVPIEKKLRKLSASKIEEMIRNAAGKTQTPTSFRAHLINFLESNEIILPNNDEMERLKKEIAAPTFRMVKRFEARA